MKTVSVVSGASLMISSADGAIIALHPWMGYGSSVGPTAESQVDNSESRVRAKRHHYQTKVERKRQDPNLRRCTSRQHARHLASLSDCKDIV